MCVHSTAESAYNKRYERQCDVTQNHTHTLARSQSQQLVNTTKLKRARDEGCLEYDY